MSKKKQNQPKKPPIYRASEGLLKWLMPVVDSLPKSLASQTLGALVIRTMHDCLNVILLARDAEDKASKVRCIRLLLVNLTEIRTYLATFTECKYISPSQEATFLDLYNPVEIQAKGWLTHWENEGDTVAGQS